MNRIEQRLSAHAAGVPVVHGQARDRRRGRGTPRRSRALTHRSPIAPAWRGSSSARLLEASPDTTPDETHERLQILANVAIPPTLRRQVWRLCMAMPSARAPFQASLSARNGLLRERQPLRRFAVVSGLEAALDDMCDYAFVPICSAPVVLYVWDQLVLSRWQMLPLLCVAFLVCLRSTLLNVARAVLMLAQNGPNGSVSPVYVAGRVSASDQAHGTTSAATRVPTGGLFAVPCAASCSDV